MAAIELLSGGSDGFRYCFRQHTASRSFEVYKFNRALKPIDVLGHDTAGIRRPLILWYILVVVLSTVGIQGQGKGTFSGDRGPPEVNPAIGA